MQKRSSHQIHKLAIGHIKLHFYRLALVEHGTRILFVVSQEIFYQAMLRIINMTSYI